MPQGVRRSRRRAVIAVVSSVALCGALLGLLPGLHGAPGGPVAGAAEAAEAAGASVRPAPVSDPAMSVDPAVPATPVAPAHRASVAGAPEPAAATTAASVRRPAMHSVHTCSQDVPAGYVACLAERRTDLPAQPGSTGSSRAAGPGEVSGQVSPQIPPSGYGPADLAAAYSVPSSTAGAGQTVYIVDAYDDPNAESDLAVYRTRFGLPACTTANGCFRKLNQSGTTSPLPSPDTHWAGEISLDVDMVSALCPSCGITLIEASTPSNTNMFAAVSRANLMGAQFVSMSWGGRELGQTVIDDSRYFSATGVVYTAASGDDGYSPGPIYPATSPRVVAVGGTSLERSSGTARGWTEQAWSGAGSGCSAEDSAPSWQVGSTPCGSYKGTTDVSAVADPDTGVAVYQTYGESGWGVYGGTSAAAPIIASIYALAGSPDPGVNPAALLYRHPHNLNDVTSGSTGSCSVANLCTATAGWDGPTGLGTPNGLTAFRLGRGKHTTVPTQVHPQGQPVRGTLLQQSSAPLSSPQSSPPSSPTSSPQNSPTSSPAPSSAATASP